MLKLMSLINSINSKTPLILLSLTLCSCFSMEGSVKDAKNKPEILLSWSKSIQNKYPAVENILATDAKKFLVQDKYPVYFIDHRNLDEQQVSMIKDATPSRDIKISTLPLNAKIIVYCTFGERSSWYISKMRPEEKGPREIYNLSGGILAWTFAAGELQTPQKQATKKVHVFGPAYNITAEGYEGVTN